tara:strand:+ start:53 stop:460 length:408 start_codon:yes stop_codon:yes gene_type:complete
MADKNPIKKTMRPEARPVKKSMRPQARPEKKYEINSAEYDGKERYVIDFKDGKRLTNNDVKMILDKNKSGEEPIPGKFQSKIIMDYLKKNNPTRAEFINHFESVGLNKGGSVKKKKTAGYNKGGMVDYRKSGLFK